MGSGHQANVSKWETKLIASGEPAWVVLAWAYAHFNITDTIGQEPTSTQGCLAGASKVRWKQCRGKVSAREQSIPSVLHRVIARRTILDTMMYDSLKSAASLQRQDAHLSPWRRCEWAYAYKIPQAFPSSSLQHRPSARICPTTASYSKNPRRSKKATKAATVTKRGTRNQHQSTLNLLLVGALLLGGTTSSSRLLGWLLLLLVLALGTGVLGERLLKDLEDLLISDLLVSLALLDVEGRWGAQTGETVLSDGCAGSAMDARSPMLAFDLPIVLKSLPTASASLSPITSYCLKTLPRTHSTTPTFASRSSSSCLRENGKVPNFLTTSDKILRELGRLRPYVVVVRR